MGKVIQLEAPAAALRPHGRSPELVSARVQLGVKDVVAVVGKRGTGKSTAAKGLLAKALDWQLRVVALDPHDEYSRHGRESDEVRLGPLDDRCTFSELMENPARWLDWERLSLAVVPREEPDECAEDFVALTKLVKSTEDLLLCVEEVGYFQEHCQPRLNFLATQSRHWRVPVLFVAQRLTHVPKTARTQLSQLISFLQDDPEDLKAMAARCGSEFAAAVASLKPGEWMHWRDTLNTAGEVPAQPKEKHR